MKTTKLIRRALLLFLAVTAAGALYLHRLNYSPPLNLSGAPLAAIESGQPRLYLAPDRIIRLREDVGGSHQQIWEQISTWVEDRLTALPPPVLEGDFRRVGELIPYAALCYLVTEEDQYLRLAKRYMLGLCGYEHWGDDIDIEAAHLLYGLALGYDWLRPALNDEEASVIREKIYSQGRRMRPLCGRKWPALNNHRVVTLAALGIAAFSLYPEHPDSREWLSYVNRLFRETVKQYGRDGWSPEGIAYWSYTLEYMLKYFVASDELLETEFLLSPWIQNAADCALYASLPRQSWSEYNMFINFSDSPRFCWYGPHYQLFKLASLTRRPEIQWLALEIADSKLSQWHSDWLSLLWYDPSVPAGLRPEQPGSKIFQDWGIAVMRGGWDGGENICAFKCSPVGGHHISYRPWSAYPGSGHMQPDANSFLIFGSGEWLAAAPGATLVKNTRDHNTVLINGVGQRGEGERWFSGRAQFSRGLKPRLIRQEINPDYDYLIGDASVIYRPEAGLDRFLRHLLYVKPNLLILADELSGKDESEYEWLLHTPGTIEIGSNGSVLIRHHNATLQISVVSPGDCVITSAAKPIPANYPDKDWRTLNVLRLSPPELSRTAKFIVVMLIGESDPAPLEANSIPAGGREGLEIRAGDLKLAIEFYDSGRTAGGQLMNLVKE